MDNTRKHAASPGTRHIAFQATFAMFGEAPVPAGVFVMFVDGQFVGFHRDRNVAGRWAVSGS